MKDSLFSNKLAAAVLVVVLLFIGLPVIAHTFGNLASGHHGEHDFNEENPFGLNYKPYAELVGGGEGKAEEVVVSLGCLLADADATRGARGAAICAACHNFEPGGANGTGPRLWGVVGRQIGKVADYNGYSAAIRGFEGEWTYEKLNAYLYDSGSFMPGTNMAQRIRKDAKRADILAYLGTLTSGEPMPFPECAPPEAEAQAPTAEIAGEAADSVTFEVPDAGQTELEAEPVGTSGDNGR